MTWIAVGVELKGSYYDQAARNLHAGDVRIDRATEDHVYLCAWSAGVPDEGDDD